MTPPSREADLSASAERARSHRGLWALAALLMLYGALAAGSAARKSVTVDELGHLPSGLHYLQTGDPRYASLNPPLVNVLSALPVLLMDLRTEPMAPDASDDPFSFWSTGYAFHERHRDDYLRIYRNARLVQIALVAGLGALLYFWARELVPELPEVAGLLAAGFVCLSPNVIAQARLVGTDTGTALFVSLALYTFRRMLVRPSAATVFLAGLALGLAQLTKLYALLLYPAALGVLFAWHGLPDRALPRRADAVRFGLVVVTSWIVLCTGYLFRDVGSPLDALPLQSDTLQGLQASWLGGVPLPLPAAYLRAMDGQLVEVASSMPSFLLGERFEGGRWDYYLIVLAIKSPLPLMIAFAVAAGLCARRPTLPPRELVLLLAYPALLFVLLSLGDRRQLGARALLSAVPLVELSVACVLARSAPLRWPLHVGAGALSWLLAVSLLAWPNYLPYTNVLAGGRDGAYRHVSDANLDIGQDLVRLAEVLDERGEGDVQLLYFGSVDPALYGIEYEVPTPESVHPGLLAVSVSLYHIRYPMYDHGRLRPVGPVVPPGRPVESIGGTIHLYEIEP